MEQNQIRGHNHHNPTALGFVVLVVLGFVVVVVLGFMRPDGLVVFGCFGRFGFCCFVVLVVLGSVILVVFVVLLFR